MVSKREHLIDRLAAADIEAAGPNHVCIQPMTISLDARTSLFLHPNSKVTFPPMRFGTGASLKVGVGLKDACWDRVCSPVRFRIEAQGPDGAIENLVDREVNVGRAEDRRWTDLEVDLSGLEGREIRLVFATEVPEGGDQRYCWAGWSDPVVEQPAARLPMAPPVLRRDGHRHVLLITADALRADHLGCYGHPEVATPNLDRLAADGCLFKHARAPSSSTLSSYASMLTGLLPDAHKIWAEWGSLPDNLPSLPAALSAAGYHTAIAPSETELATPAFGFTAPFEHCIACLGRPAQDGAVTTRQAVGWLRKGPPAPWFLWAQYFDTHPPAIPPEPFRSMYYRGDPTDPSRQNKRDWIRMIHGVESVLAISAGIESIGRQHADAGLLSRLRDTALVLTGRLTAGPDLVVHLRALGPRACRGQTPERFGAWLLDRSEALARGEPCHELVSWLEDLLPLLKEVEREIRSWLEAVVDSDYPLAQYKAGVSYFDHQVGELIAALRDLGLYDQTTVVVASPHGEVLLNADICFHHHLLWEEVLRVPLIIKADRPSGARRGTRPEGVFDLVDLFPTLIEALGLTPPETLDGVSRWRHVIDGTTIPDHDSFAVEAYGALSALFRPPLGYYEAHCRYRACDRWDWFPGDRALRRIDEPLVANPVTAGPLPDPAEAMRNRLVTRFGVR